MAGGFDAAIDETVDAFRSLHEFSNRGLERYESAANDDDIHQLAAHPFPDVDTSSRRVVQGRGYADGELEGVVPLCSDIVEASSDALDQVGHEVSVLECLIRTKVSWVAHEVEFDSVDVETLERLEDDGCHVLPHFREGVILPGSEPPVQAALRQVLGRLADEQARMLSSEAPVCGIARVDLIVAVHSHAGEELQSSLSAQSRQGGERPAALLDERADVPGDGIHDSGRVGVNE